MRRANRGTRWVLKMGVVGLYLAAASSFMAGQQPLPAATASHDGTVDSTLQDLREEVQQLRAAIAELRSETAQYRAETVELRREIQEARTQTPGPSTEADAARGELPARVAALEESTALLNDKVDEQYQTKVESASKYHVRLSGIALLNLFADRGPFENTDFPSYVPKPTPFNSSPVLGATMRQSELGLEVFGPTFAGAHTSGQIQVDFAGGFPSTLNGANFGVLRLRIASMRMDWANTSLIVGQDNLFVSPLSPTSFASLAIPALSYQGNLWGWVPQIRVEHRFRLTEGQNLLVQAGLLDNLSGEPPFVAFDRGRQAGEASGQPAYGLRLAWTRQLFNHPLTVGTAGYYGRQNWGFGRNLDGWAGMVDWDVPVSQRLSLSGEFYRGRAIGGLGGGVGRSALYSGSIFDPATRVIGLDSVGGWSQLKFRATSKLEFNGALGLDNPMANDVRLFPASVSYFDRTLTQNRSALVNFVYRPRSNLLFSTEYRRLQTFVIDSGSQSAGQTNLMMGILF